ncbi:MAG: hypothetical protein HYR83_10925 [Planctomycetes bacterium]|nr:hypothetical protein [Planctomycetota bacterium]
MVILAKCLFCWHLKGKVIVAHDAPPGNNEVAPTEVRDSELTVVPFYKGDEKNEHSSDGKTVAHFFGAGTC